MEETAIIYVVITLIGIIWTALIVGALYAIIKMSATLKEMVKIQDHMLKQLEYMNALKDYELSENEDEEPPQSIQQYTNKQ